LLCETSDKAAAVQVDVQRSELTGASRWLEDEAPFWTATGWDVNDPVGRVEQERWGFEESGEESQGLEEDQSPSVCECDGGEYSIGCWLEKAR
jgi:hypothetical protein